ncbi:hypothetical protein [Streptomyces sp. NRRL S-350]|nr:hypothetical protein [Streptomyces sp. NRRL S-350]
MSIQPVLATFAPETDGDDVEPDGEKVAARGTAVPAALVLAPGLEAPA